MTRSLVVLALVVLICAAAPAATINTTLTVTNATGPLAGTSITVTGPATLTGGIGNGTFSGTLALTGGDATFTITLTTGDKINGTIAIPITALTGGSLSGTTAKITGGTGTYAGATGSLTLSSGSLTLGVSISLTFTAAGTITTGGGGPAGPPTPTITTVQNNYGLVPPGLPNYGIAPSTLFFVKGDSLSNSTTPDLISSASPGLPDSLNGVSVNVTAGGTTKKCSLYYLSPGQIDAVLPGDTPVGNATITVTNNGATSAPFQIPVVQSAFGILGYNGSLAAAYDPNFIITATNAANPGQTIVLWGSGVGGDSNDDDKLFPQKQDNLTNIPMQAFVGGVQATIAYRGRSQFPGLDQVVLTIPSNAPTGCFVSLAIVSGNMVSNSVTIPIAASGRTCTDAGTALPPDLFNTLAGKTTLKIGELVVAQSTSVAATTRTDSSVGAFFQSISGLSGAAGVANQVSVGSCLVSNSLQSGTSSVGTLVGLDAGASINVTGPAGSLALTQIALLGPGFYAPPNGTVPASFIPNGGGTFTFDNGSGGKDVQHFNASLTLPAAFTWTNPSSIASVTRSQGVTVTWTGGASGTTVSISGGSSLTVSGKSVTVSFTCQAPVSAGTFTVPPSVLLMLPAGTGSLSVSDVTNFQSFTAGGLDLGLALGSNDWSKSLSYN